MKSSERKLKKFNLITRQFGIVLILVGGVSVLNGNETGKLILSVGGILFAFYSFLKVFEPIEEEPNWELVYPELGLGHSEDLDHDVLAKEK